VYVLEQGFIPAPPRNSTGYQSTIATKVVVHRDALLRECRQSSAIVFVIQTLLTAITSGAMALYTLRVAHDQEHIENCLVQSHAAARPSCGPAVPASLAQWAGWFNCAAMIAMAALWLYVGFIC
jgi:hypothetical protein